VNRHLLDQARGFLGIVGNDLDRDRMLDDPLKQAFGELGVGGHACIQRQGRGS
jgi:hypothetical protein